MIRYFSMPTWRVDSIFLRAPIFFGLTLACSTALPGGMGSSPTSSNVLLGQVASSADMSSAMRVFLLLTALSFIPAALICMTSFVRIVVVLSMLRHAIGLNETPPNMVVITLALFLTLFSMQPVLEKVNREAVQPYVMQGAKLDDSLEKGKAPIKEYMIRQTRETDLMLMIEVASAPRPEGVDDVNMLHLIPAYMLSELRSAFQIGFMVFLPFLLIDLIVASVLMALGMMMVPPATVSVPIKLLLFVLIDGWHIVVRALLGSFH
ncbi:flagellar type III secretion system pore protein FliP [Paucibacter sp. KBW04]|uniref:flagellar type III secretion system pore protein FliP n=1 Tax=Paucibacter sp. KBW04 TaxID=2153361 RepID=UPI001E5B25C1|nr:flagellar type III secretion system pore protein FliP [Paucibacter sp. KBW04]